MVGAFLAGAVMDAHWFKRDQLDALRDHVLLIVMPVFFLSTGLRTNWAIGGPEVLLAATALLLMAVVSTMLTVPVVSRLDRGS